MEAQFSVQCPSQSYDGNSLRETSALEGLLS